MPTISFTKEEISALWHAAGNMQDDFEDYFSFMPNVEKYHKSFESGMSKLSKHLEKAKELTKTEEQAHNYETENSDEAKRH